MLCTKQRKTRQVISILSHGKGLNGRPSNIWGKTSRQAAVSSGKVTGTIPKMTSLWLSVFILMRFRNTSGNTTPELSPAAQVFSPLLGNYQGAEIK